MFAVSTKAKYGLAAVVELALNYNKGHIQIRNIANGQGIPQHYLEQLLLILKKSGFVNSFRGAQGGYSLAMAPEQIKVLDILTCLEGDLEIADRTGKKDSLYFFWRKVEEKILRSFDLTLEKLILEKQRYEGVLSYNI